MKKTSFPRLILAVSCAVLLSLGLSFLPHFLPYEHLNGFYALTDLPSFRKGQDAVETGVVVSVSKDPSAVWLLADGKRYARLSGNQTDGYRVVLGKELFENSSSIEFSIELEYQWASLRTNSITVWATE